MMEQYMRVVEYNGKNTITLRITTGVSLLNG